MLYCLSRKHGCWELTFAANSNRSESSIDSSSSDSDSDSDLTDTSELAQPLAEQNCCEVSHFLRMYSSIRPLLEFICIYLHLHTHTHTYIGYMSHGMTSPTMPHSSQSFSAGERTVLAAAIT
jgi:hypothetical protein